MKYEYRMREIYRKNDKHTEWQKCTAAQKEQIEKSAGAKFEFREVKKPEPTPNMKDSSKMEKSSKMKKDN